MKKVKKIDEIENASDEKKRQRAILDLHISQYKKFFFNIGRYMSASLATGESSFVPK